MEPYLNIVGVGSAADYLRQLPDECIDAWVTDPPAGIGFMGVGWDTFADRKGDLGRQDGVWDKPGGTKRNAANSAEHARLNRREGQRFIDEMTTIFVECFRTLKPGAHGIVWALPRTSHWTGVALENAGFEMRDMIVHLFGSGFPKSQDVEKFIAKSGEDGRAWKGWGTALKPAYEVWWLVRKPPIGTVAANVLEHGTGAINIDESRVGRNPGWSYPKGKGGSGWGDNQGGGGFEDIPCESTAGRWPANVVLSHLPECELVGTTRTRTGTAVKRNLPPEGASRRVGNKARTQRGDDEGYADADGKEEVEDWHCAKGCPVAELDRQSVESGMHGAGHPDYSKTRGAYAASSYHLEGAELFRYGDDGGASRFFYTPKAATKERWAYCETCKLAFQHNRETFKAHEGHDVASHPTQKPIELMKYLIKLVTPPGGVVLDTFCGTGTTSVAARKLGFDFVTCDREEPYARIAEARLAQLGMSAAARAALTTGAYFCPGCRERGEIKLLSKQAVERMRADGKKTTCMKCMRRFTFEDLARERPT